MGGVNTSAPIPQDRHGAKTTSRLASEATQSAKGSNPHPRGAAGVAFPIIPLPSRRLAARLKKPSASRRVGGTFVKPDAQFMCFF